MTDLHERHATELRRDRAVISLIGAAASLAHHVQEYDTSLIDRIAHIQAANLSLLLQEIEQRDARLAELERRLAALESRV